MNKISIQSTEIHVKTIENGEIQLLNILSRLENIVILEDIINVIKSLALYQECTQEYACQTRLVFALAFCHVFSKFYLCVYSL